MNAVMNQVIAWLAGFEGVEGAQRVTPDILEDGDMSLSDLPEDSVVGVENDPYGVRALVRRDMVPHDLPLEHTNLEDIILFLAKGGTRK